MSAAASCDAALLLKYAMARDTEYERRLASAQRVRWQATAAARARQVETEHEQALEDQRNEADERKTEEHARRAEHELRRRALNASGAIPELVGHAAAVAGERVSGRLAESRRSPFGGSRFAKAGDHVDDDASDERSPGTIVDDALGDMASGRNGAGERSAPAPEPRLQAPAPNHESPHPIFEVLGGRRSQPRSPTSSGGLYLYLQFREAGLPTLAVLASMPGARSSHRGRLSSFSRLSRSECASS